MRATVTPPRVGSLLLQNSSSLPGEQSAARACRAFGCATIISMAAASLPLVRLRAHTTISLRTCSTVSRTALVTDLTSAGLMPLGWSSRSIASSS